MCEGKLEDENGRIEIGEIGDPLFFPRESPLVNALYKAYVDVTGDTKNEPMVIGGGTYAKSLKNIIAFGPEKLDTDYHIHGADEYILVSEMEGSGSGFIWRQSEICLSIIRGRNMTKNRI